MVLFLLRRRPFFFFGFQRIREEVADPEHFVVARAMDLESTLALQIVAFIACLGLSLRFNNMGVDEVVEIHAVLHLDSPVDYFAR